MYHSKSLVAMFATVALSIFACACAKVEPAAKDYNFSAEIKTIGETSVEVAFHAGADITKVEYACGSIFTSAQDSDKFKKSILTTTKSVPAKDSTFTVNMQCGEPSVIYIRCVKDTEEKGEVICLKAVTGPVKYELSKVSLGSFVYTVPDKLEGYAGIGMLSMVATAPEEWFMTAEEIVRMYADYFMIDCTNPGQSAMVELNGEPEVDQILGIVYWKEDFTYDIKIVNFKSGSIIADAPAASIDAKFEKLTDKSVDLVFTPSESTYGYCYRLFTKEDYDETLATGKELGKDPVEYVRELVAAGGTMDYRQKTDSRTGLKAGTEYVLACFPYNVNGSQGWGGSQIVSFKTATVTVL